MTEVIPTCVMRDSEVLAADKQTAMREESSSISDINSKKIKPYERLTRVRLASKKCSRKENFLRALCGTYMKICLLENSVCPSFCPGQY